jgi:hypothetical protein
MIMLKKHMLTDNPCRMTAGYGPKHEVAFRWLLGVQRTWTQGAWRVKNHLEVDLVFLCLAPSINPIQAGRVLRQAVAIPPLTATGSQEPSPSRLYSGYSDDFGRLGQLRKCLILLAHRAGFEPTTPRFVDSPFTANHRMQWGALARSRI